MFPQSYFITKMFCTTCANIEAFTFLPHVPIVSPYKFFDLHFPGTGQVSRKRNLCGNRRAETGLIQHCAGHRTSLQGELQNNTVKIFKIKFFGVNGKFTS